MDINQLPHGADGYSIAGFTAYVLIDLSTHFNPTDPMTWLGIAVGLSTLAYNIIRIRKETKQ